MSFLKNDGFQKLNSKRLYACMIIFLPFTFGPFGEPTWDDYVFIIIE